MDALDGVDPVNYAKVARGKVAPFLDTVEDVE